MGDQWLLSTYIIRNSTYECNSFIGKTTTKLNLISIQNKKALLIYRMASDAMNLITYLPICLFPTCLFYKKIRGYACFLLAVLA